MKKWKYIKPVNEKWELDIKFLKGFKFVVVTGLCWMRAYLYFEEHQANGSLFEQGKSFNIFEEAQSYCEKYYKILESEHNDKNKK